MIRINFRDMRSDPRAGFGNLYRQVTGRPSWPLKIALLIGSLVVVVPLVVLAIAGLVVGVAVFIVLSLVARLLEALGLASSPAESTPARNDPPYNTDGRENVHVLKDE